MKMEPTTVRHARHVAILIPDSVVWSPGVVEMVVDDGSDGGAIVVAALLSPRGLTWLDIIADPGPRAVEGRSMRVSRFQSACCCTVRVSEMRVSFSLILPTSLTFSLALCVRVDGIRRVSTVSRLFLKIDLMLDRAESFIRTLRCDLS
jgi:hypothetical protein